MDAKGAMVLGPIYTLCSVVGLSACFYLLISTAQRTFSWRNVVIACSAFTNLLGFAISPSLVATSLLIKFPLNTSYEALKLGDVGFVAGFILYCLAYTSSQYRSRTKELSLIHAGVLLANLVECAALIPALKRNLILLRTVHLICLGAALSFLSLNLGVCFLMSQRVGVIFTYRKVSPAGQPPAQLSERDIFRRQCALLCFVLVTLSFLPKITYDAFEWITMLSNSGLVGGADRGYFEMNTFLMTRTLVYLSAFVQTVSSIKLLPTLN